MKAQWGERVGRILLGDIIGGEAVMLWTFGSQCVEH
jgi:hypothetical protein